MRKQTGPLCEGCLTNLLVFSHLRVTFVPALYVGHIFANWGTRSYVKLRSIAWVLDEEIGSMCRVDIKTAPSNKILRKAKLTNLTCTVSNNYMNTQRWRIVSPLTSDKLKIYYELVLSCLLINLSHRSDKGTSFYSGRQH